MSTSVRRRGRWLTSVLGACALVACHAHVPVLSDGNLLVPGVYPGSLSLENHTNDMICYVRITRDSSAWGEDHLRPAETIDPGATRHFHVGQGTWRVRLEDCSRRAVFQRDALAVGPEGRTLRFFVRE